MSEVGSWFGPCAVRSRVRRDLKKPNPLLALKPPRCKLDEQKVAGWVVGWAWPAFLPLFVAWAVPELDLLLDDRRDRWRKYRGSGRRRDAGADTGAAGGTPSPKRCRLTRRAIGFTLGADVFRCAAPSIFDFCSSVEQGAGLRRRVRARTRPRAYWAQVRAAELRLSSSLSAPHPRKGAGFFFIPS